MPGQGIQPLGTGGIYLIKGKGTQPDGHTAHGVLNIPRPIQGDAFQPGDYIGALGIHIQQDGLDFREPLQHGGAERFTVRQAAAIDDKTQHNLPGMSAPAQKNMPHQAGMAGFVIGGNSVFVHPGADCLGNLVQNGRLKQAIFTGDNPMTAAGIKTGDRMAPLVPLNRELNLIAIAVLLRGSQHLVNGQFQPSNAAERIQNKAFFGLQLGPVGQMPETAPAAGAADGAVLVPAAGAGLLQLVHNAVSIPLAVLDNARRNPIAGCGIGYKNGLALISANPAAFTGQCTDSFVQPFSQSSNSRMGRYRQCPSASSSRPSMGGRSAKRLMVSAAAVSVTVGRS